MMRVLTGLTAVVVLSLAACAAKPPLVTQCTKQGRQGRGGPALVGLTYGTQATPIPLNSVQFSNWNVERSVSIQQLWATRTATNTVNVMARLISCADQPFAIRVRTSFLDSNQAPAEPASAWKTVFLQPRATAVYSENSTSRDVVNYLIDVAPQ